MFPDRPASGPLFRPLRARLAGRPADESLYAEVPLHATTALSEWLREFEAADHDKSPPLVTRVCLRLCIAPPTPWSTLASLSEREHDLLEMIDAALQLRGSTATAYGELDDYPLRSNGQYQRDLLQQLDNTLRHGRIAFRVARSGNQLEHRLDPTVVVAAEQAAATANPTTAELLAVAWEKAYGLQPDPAGCQNWAWVAEQR